MRSFNCPDIAGRSVGAVSLRLPQDRGMIDVMQSQPLTASEAVAVLKRKIQAVQADGLSRAQAVRLVARQLGLDPMKVAAIVGVREGA